MIVTVDAGQLAGLAAAEARQHPPRTPERRAAAALYVTLTETASIDAARRALPGFAAPETVTAALELLGRLTERTPA